MHTTTPSTPDRGRRHVLTAALAAAGASAWPAWAQAYPNRPIRWIVPYAAGGASDLVARLAGEALGNALGQRVVIDNRPGAASTVGIGMLASSPPDGYTLATADNATLFNNWHLFDKLPYTPDSFEYVSPLMRAPLVLTLSPSVPAKTFQEWVSWARQNRGKVSYGTPGIGSPHHLAMALLNDRLELGMQHIPYKGDSAAVVDVVSGVLPCMLMGVATARQYMKEGKLNFVAMNWPSRLSSMPEVPTLDEVGVKDFEAGAEPRDRDTGQQGADRGDEHARHQGPAGGAGRLPPGEPQRGRAQGLCEAPAGGGGRCHQKEWHHHQLRPTRRCIRPKLSRTVPKFGEFVGFGAQESALSAAARDNTAAGLT